MGKLVELLSGGVGLVAEGISQRSGSDRYSSQRPSNCSQQPQIRSSYSNDYYPNSSQPTYPSQRYDRADYEEGQYYPNDSRNPPAYTSEVEYGDQYSDSMVQRDPPPFNQTERYDSTPQGPLPLPIIIPQRRPENKSRGWMIAYAPELRQCGIDQEAFVNFLLGFNKACQASPALDAVNLAAFGVGFAPGIAPMVVSMVVPMAVNAAKTAQTNTQASNYLSRANAEIFEPCGLVAMITTFNDQQSQVISYQSGYQDPTQQSGQEFTLPRSLQLIYLEDGQIPTGQARSGVNKVGHFIGDYYDRRSQAQYAVNNPQFESSGLRPPPRFANRWSDPGNGGSLISLVSGGTIRRPAKADKDADKQAKKAAKEQRKRGYNSDPDAGYDNGQQGRLGLISGVKGMIGGSAAQNQSLLGVVKGKALGDRYQDQGLIKGIKGRVAQEDLLYLMILNRT